MRDQQQPNPPAPKEDHYRHWINSWAKDIHDLKNLKRLQDFAQHMAAIEWRERKERNKNGR